jgi:hypothetical protein
MFCSTFFKSGKSGNIIFTYCNMSNATSNVTAYPSNRLNKASNFITMFDTVLLPYNKQFNNCSNTLCYTYSKNFIYKPHTAYGMVGRTSAGYLAQRRRL